MLLLKERPFSFYPGKLRLFSEETTAIFKSHEVALFTGHSTLPGLFIILNTRHLSTDLLNDEMYV